MFIDQAIRWKLIENNLPAPPVRIFEVGFGNGDLMRHLQKKGYFVQGGERSAEAITFARRDGLDDQVFLMDSAIIPLPDESVDCVVSSDVLEHVLPQDRFQLLTEMLRITKPGGVLAISYWTKNNLAFRIYGGLHLLRMGLLPQWYLEHITLTPPAIAEVESFLSKERKVLRSLQYQGPANMLFSCVDHLYGNYYPRAHRMLLSLCRVIRALDWFGGCTSHFLLVQK